LSVRTSFEHSASPSVRNVDIKMAQALSPSISDEARSTAMATDSPSPHSNRKPYRPPSPAVSPAQSIAEAWKRESSESQEKWRRIDVNVRARYTAPRRQDTKPKM